MTEHPELASIARRAADQLQMQVRMPTFEMASKVADENYKRLLAKLPPGSSTLEEAVFWTLFWLRLRLVPRLMQKEDQYIGKWWQVNMAPALCLKGCKGDTLAAKGWREPLCARMHALIKHVCMYVSMRYMRARERE